MTSDTDTKSTPEKSPKSKSHAMMIPDTDMKSTPGKSPKSQALIQPSWEKPKAAQHSNRKSQSNALQPPKANNWTYQKFPSKSNKDLLGLSLVSFWLWLPAACLGKQTKIFRLVLRFFDTRCGIISANNPRDVACNLCISLTSRKEL